MLNKKIELKDSLIHGQGLFAKEKILKDEKIWWVDPENDTRQFYTREESCKLNYEDNKMFNSYAYQYDDDCWVLDSEIEKYTNHSCDPTTWNGLDGALETVARRDIEVGEEITCDFATFFDATYEWSAPCNCGSENCRVRVSSRDFLSPIWQELNKGRIPTFQLCAIEKYNVKQKNRNQN